MQVNPEPLKIVPIKAGDWTAPKMFAVASVVRKFDNTVQRLSIHSSGCTRTPKGEHWRVETMTPNQVDVAVSHADRDGARITISCRSCGGWSIF